MLKIETVKPEIDSIAKERFNKEFAQHNRQTRKAERDARKYNKQIKKLKIKKDG